MWLRLISAAKTRKEAEQLPFLNAGGFKDHTGEQQGPESGAQAAPSREAAWPQESVTANGKSRFSARVDTLPALRTWSVNSVFTAMNLITARLPITQCEVIVLGTTAALRRGKTWTATGFSLPVISAPTSFCYKALFVPLADQNVYVYVCPPHCHHESGASCPPTPSSSQATAQRLGGVPAPGLSCTVSSPTCWSWTNLQWGASSVHPRCFCQGNMT